MIEESLSDKIFDQTYSGVKFFVISELKNQDTVLLHEFNPYYFVQKEIESQVNDKIIGRIWNSVGGPLLASVKTQVRDEARDCLTIYFDSR